MSGRVLASMFATFGAGQGDNVTVQTLKDGYTTRPTGVAVVGKTAWVSEGQLSYLLDPALKGQKPSLPFQISSVPLPAAH
jgi:hypothetical protein